MSRLDETTVMRQWITETAHRLSTFSRMPSDNEIAAMPDEQIREAIERYYTGGLRLFRWTLRNGGEI